MPKSARQKLADRQKRQHSIRKQLALYSTTPFLDEVAYLMGFRPTPQALQEFADQHPDKWANCIAIFAKLAGYAENLNLNVDATLNVQSLSDSQLEQRLEILRASRALLPTPQVVTPNTGSPNKLPTNTKDSQQIESVPYRDVTDQK